jgi:hypothetical protein
LRGVAFRRHLPEKGGPWSLLGRLSKYGKATYSSPQEGAVYEPILGHNYHPLLIFLNRKTESHSYSPAMVFVPYGLGLVGFY